MWTDNSIFYQIYPLGFCGAPATNNGTDEPTQKIRKITDWIPHMTELGIDALYLCPFFESDAHGYDTRDFRLVDRRLGTNEDFAAVCEALHSANIKVVLDGVFHHVGRGFFAFEDVKKNREASPYKDWFYINFGGNSPYNDGFYYEGWEGHFELVKLNLDNDSLVTYLLDSVRMWADTFKIDGLRLDVAYLLNENFLRRLHDFCRSISPEFFLLGEILHGDYNRIVNDSMLDSATNYECYKGLHSSFNSNNMFEIMHSLNRQFGPEQWTLYKGKHLFAFVDNHDVSRIASILTQSAHLPLIYALLFGMPGIPCVYYGSEWGARADKNEGDAALRPCFDAPQSTELTAYISALAKVRKESTALCNGSFRTVHLTNRQCIFERACDNQRMLVAINIDENPYTAHFDAGCASALDLLSGETLNIGGGFEMKGYTAYYLKV